MRTKNEEIKQGALIHTESPFAYVLSAKVQTEYCDHCFNNGDLLKCSGCHYVYYCGRTCQKESWPIHKQECRSLRKVAPRVVPDAVRLLARLIRILQKGGDQIKVYYTENKFRMFKDLMSHYTDLKEDKHRMEHFVSLCGVLYDFLGENFMPNSAELMGIYGRMCINSFNICNQELQSIGTGIYLGASVIDHSCKPNAVAIFEGTTLNIRALENIKHFDWSKIFISYIDILNVPEVRQNELRATYYFNCNCANCIHSPPHAVMCGAACPNSTCDASIDINNLHSIEFKCPKCNTLISDAFVKEFKEVEEFSAMHLANMKQQIYLDVCKVCLKKQHGVLYRFNIQHVKTLDFAFESSIDFGQWEDAKKFGLELIEGYRYYYGEINPLLGLLYLKLGKIMVYQEDSCQALEYLKKSEKILKITHGCNSSLYKKELQPLVQQATAESSLM